MSEYNPFAHNSGYGSISSSTNPATAPAPVVASPPPAPTYNAAPIAQPSPAPVVSSSKPSSFASPSTDELARRLAEVERREADVAAREQAVMNRESNGQFIAPNNWPRCFPFLYHDISAEVPTAEGRRSLVRQAYVGWLALYLLMFWNLICSIVAWSQNTAASDNISTGAIHTITNSTEFGYAIAYFIFTCPTSWLCWYRPLYTAARHETSRMWKVIIAFLSLLVLFLSVLAIGVSESGLFGVAIMIESFKNGNHATGICSLACFLYAVVMVLYFVYVAARVWSFSKTHTSKQPMAHVVVEPTTQGLNVSISPNV